MPALSVSPPRAQYAVSAPKITRAVLVPGSSGTVLYMVFPFPMSQKIEVKKKSDAGILRRSPPKIFVADKLPARPSGSSGSSLISWRGAFPRLVREPSLKLQSRP